jgi:hypothetical protein
MLRQVLRELESAKSAVNLNELSCKLDIERSALEGMIAYLVRKGKLQDDDQALAAAMGVCSSGSCGGSCPGPQGCPYVVKMPRTFSLTSQGSNLGNAES